jgi:hypothetical protein
MLYKATERFFAHRRGEIIDKGQTLDLEPDEAEAYRDHLTRARTTTQARVRRTS